MWSRPERHRASQGSWTLGSNNGDGRASRLSRLFSRTSGTDQPVPARLRPRCNPREIECRDSMPAGSDSLAVSLDAPRRPKFTAHVHGAVKRLGIIGLLQRECGPLRLDRPARHAPRRSHAELPGPHLATGEKRGAGPGWRVRACGRCPRGAAVSAHAGRQPEADDDGRDRRRYTRIVPLCGGGSPVRRPAREPRSWAPGPESKRLLLGARRRASARDVLRSTSVLMCPSSPERAPLRRIRRSQHEKATGR